MIRIGIDAMGGDFAPNNVILGAIEAHSYIGTDTKIFLIGDEKKITEVCQHYGIDSGNFVIVHAPPLSVNRNAQIFPQIEICRKVRNLPIFQKICHYLSSDCSCFSLQIRVHYAKLYLSHRPGGRILRCIYRGSISLPRRGNYGKYIK